MIIKFSGTICSKKDNQSLINLSKLLKDSNLINHKMNISEDILEWICENILEDNSFFAEYEKRCFAEILERITGDSVYITQLHKAYLTEIIIGYGNNEIAPEIVQQIIDKPSKVILENGTNDWKFVKGVVAKYKKHSERGSIYKLINNSIENRTLQPEHAGGSNIKPRIISLIVDQRYDIFFKYKLYVLFDSDRNTSNTISQKHLKLIHFLKSELNVDDLINNLYHDTDFVIWHMLYKREIENYIPCKMLSVLGDSVVNNLSQLTEEEYDFMDIEKEAYKIDKKIDTKEILPDIFLNPSLNREMLEDRCKHHKLRKSNNVNHVETEISELEYILLDLARII